MSERNWRFSTSYVEDLPLAGGLRATLRRLEPGDREALVEGFEHVGARSRYFRFFTGKPELTQADLRYFTEIDGVKHFAIGALVHDKAGHEHPAAIGRFICYADADHAEFAITVVDEYQHLGLGSVILDRLMGAARERGVKELHGEVLAENSVMLGLVKHVAPDASFLPEGAIVRCIIPLGEV